MREPDVYVAPILTASKVFRTGKQSLYRYNGRWFVRLENRMNDTWVPIPDEKAEIWKELLA